MLSNNKCTYVEISDKKYQSPNSVLPLILRVLRCCIFCFIVKMLNYIRFSKFMHFC